MIKRKNMRHLAIVAALLLSFSASAGILREAVYQVGGQSVAPAVGETMQLQSFDGNPLQMQIESRSVSSTGIVAYGGRTVGSSMNNVSVVMTDGGFVATVQDRSTGNILRFRLDGDAIYLREETKPSGGRCGVLHRRKHADALKGLSRKEVAKPLTGDPLVDGAHFLERGETVTNVIDVLIVIDKSAAKWINRDSVFAGDRNAVALFAADSISRCNNMYANTGLNKFFTFNLAGVYNLDIDCSKRRDEEGYVDSEVLIEFLQGDETPSSTRESALYSKVRDYRNRVNADIVACLVSCGQEELSGTVGLSYAFDDDTIREPDYAESAYSVCLVEAVSIGNTLAHEIGHIMGAGHAEMADKGNSGPQLYDYSTGYYFSVTNALGNVFMHGATVMGYDSDGYDDDYPPNGRWGVPPTYAVDPDYWMAGMYTETLFFSSPNYTYKYLGESGDEIDSGVPLGDEKHDNTRLISLTYPLIANFRVRGEGKIEEVVGGKFDAAFAKMQEVSGVLYDAEGGLAGVVQMKAGKMSKAKNTVKLSATVTLINGKKVTATAVKVDMTGGTVSETLTFKAPIGDMAFNMSSDGTFTLTSDAFTMSEGTVGGEWKKSAANVSVDVDDVSMFTGNVLTNLLPTAESATVSGGKWTFRKAARVRWAKPKKGAAQPEIYDETSGKGLIVDVDADKTNLSGIKLTYSYRKGTFKGRFKVYALEGEGAKTKLKKYNVKVSGLVVDGLGTGEAVCKKPSAVWAVNVE